MLWAEEIPVFSENDSNNNKTEVTVIAGKIGNVTAPAPAPDSWAADPENEICIWLIKMQPDARWTIPMASPGINRSLYFYRGNEIRIAGIAIKPYHSTALLADQPVIVENGNSDSWLLMLQGKPINEPVVQHGPFVMNTTAEIQQAFYDYRMTRFGGWPWTRNDNVHGPQKRRFAKYSDGKEEIK
jgi:redox-sensitive bicupin YhaK (pirin superfamily)